MVVFAFLPLNYSVSQILKCQPEPQDVRRYKLYICELAVKGCDAVGLCMTVEGPRGAKSAQMRVLLAQLNGAFMWEVSQRLTSHIHI
jgi:hypothetical protein